MAPCLLTVLLAAAQPVEGLPWVRPPALRPGDTIAFVAPAGEAEFVVLLPADRAKPRCLVPGTVRGRLVGGNLSLIAATVGTPYEIEPAGNILFLEDTGKEAYRLDRMLAQQRPAGLLDRFAGVVGGTFDGTDEGELAAVLMDHFGGRRVPMLLDFPVGHTQFNATLPHGGRVEWTRLPAPSGC